MLSKVHSQARSAASTGGTRTASVMGVTSGGLYCGLFPLALLGLPDWRPVSQLCWELVVVKKEEEQGHAISALEYGVAEVHRDQPCLPPWKETQLPSHQQKTDRLCLR